MSELLLRYYKLYRLIPQKPDTYYVCMNCAFWTKECKTIDCSIDDAMYFEPVRLDSVDPLDIVQFRSKRYKLSTGTCKECAFTDKIRVCLKLNCFGGDNCFKEVVK